MILRFKGGMVQAEPTKIGETLTVRLDVVDFGNQVELAIGRAAGRSATIRFDGNNTAVELARRLRHMADFIEEGAL